MNPKQQRELRRQEQAGEQQTITAADVGELVLEEPGTPRVVAAVMAASGVNKMGAEQRKSERIEKAMSDAVTQAMAEGIDINDTEKIKARMLGARQALLDEEAEAERRAAEELETQRTSGT